MPPRSVGVMTVLGEKDAILHIWINPNTATKRTRNRVKEGGPLFQFFENKNRDGEILLRSEKTGWYGWLPLTEIGFQLIAGKLDKVEVEKNQSHSKKQKESE